MKTLQRHHLLVLHHANTISGKDREAEISSVIRKAEQVVLEAEPIQMVQSIVECVGFLAAPRAKSAEKEVGEHMSDQAKARLQLAQQTRLRTVLIQLLGLLELTDPNTRRCLLLPQQHVQALLQGQNLQGVCAVKQWRLLKQAFEFGKEQNSHKGYTAQEIVENPQRGMKTKGTIPKTTSIHDGKYKPNARIRALPNVCQKQEAVTFRCTGCGHCISSNWYLTRQSGETRVIRPHNGHKSGTYSGKKKICGYFKASDGCSVKSVDDSYNIFGIRAAQGSTFDTTKQLKRPGKTGK